MNSIKLVGTILFDNASSIQNNSLQKVPDGFPFGTFKLQKFTNLTVMYIECVRPSGKIDRLPVEVTKCIREFVKNYIVSHNDGRFIVRKIEIRGSISSYISRISRADNTYNKARKILTYITPSSIKFSDSASENCEPTYTTSSNLVCDVTIKDVFPIVPIRNNTSRYRSMRCILDNRTLLHCNMWNGAVDYIAEDRLEYRIEGRFQEREYTDKNGNIQSAYEVAIQKIY